MRYATVCSGIEAPSVAWHALGWMPVFFSEIEKFPRVVLRHHYPNVPNMGDMTKFKEWPDATFDVFCGGTPCQSFSVAGLRKGLGDPRGSLMLTYLAIAARYRPRWVVWENVPGVLSINGGRDFGSFLGGLGFLGYGFAYRVLDAQYARLAQRRRRVFVVGCAGDWRSAAAVLFERHSLSGHPAPRRETGQGIAGTFSARSEGGGGLKTDFECDGGVVTHSLRGEGFDASEDGTGRGIPLVPAPHAAISPALKARDGKGVSSDGDGDGAILVPMAIQAGALKENPMHGPGGVGIRGDGVADTLEARAEVQAVAFSCKDYAQDADIISPTLRAMGHADSHQNGGGQVAVAFDLRGREGGAMMEGPHHTANLRASSGGSSRSYLATPVAVRRLTPRECERLQGFPDDYTLIPYNGKPAKDGPRYKALGNSMAVPVMRWIGERIALVDGLRAPDAAAA